MTDKITPELRAAGYLLMAAQNFEYINGVHAPRTESKMLDTAHQYGNLDGFYDLPFQRVLAKSLIDVVGIVERDRNHD